VREQDDWQHVEVWKGVEPVRRRPGMYVGDTADGSGLHHMFWEVVGNTVDQHLSRNATELWVEIDAKSWITVRDDGPGIPVDMLPTDRTVLETVFTQLHTGATYGGHFPHVHVSVGMRGFGLAVVSALSAKLEVETTRDGVRWAQAYARGAPTTGVRRLGPTSIEGTLIRFQPDPEIFSRIDFDLATVTERLQQIAWLNPLLRVFFQERRLSARGGLRSWVEKVATSQGALEALYSTYQYADGVFVDVAIGWNASSETLIRSFVNVQETLSGTHVNGLWRGLADCARRLGASVRGTTNVRKVLEPGLVAILHVGLYAPELGGPMRVHLESPIAGAAVRHILESDLPLAMQRDLRLRAHLHRRLAISSGAPSTESS
jgi:DNA gyrase subunit B